MKVRFDSSIAWSHKKPNGTQRTSMSWMPRLASMPALRLF